METLAAFFVTLVTVVNAFAPKANLPRVLGVNITQNAAIDTAVDQSDDIVMNRERIQTRNVVLEEAKAKREAEREEIKAKREAAKEDFEVRREEQKQKREEIRDARKKGIIEKVEQIMSRNNEVRTNHLNEVLGRLGEIMAKIQSRIEKISAQGVDVSTANSALETAKTAVSNAQEAVSEQAGKSYIVEVTGEDKLRQDAQVTFTQFKSDIKSAYNLVKSARDSVKSAIEAVKALRPIESTNEGGAGNE